MKNKRSKWCYASGCTGRDLCYTLVALFFISYIQFTHLVNATQFAVLTAIIVLCRVWDAVNDPMMGTIISNTKTKFGKYRPWVLIGALVNAVVLILMFTVRVDVGTDPNMTLGWWNVAILGILYLLWGMTFTMNDVAYWSLLPVLAEDKKDRDNLTTMVAVFASIGAFIAGGVIPLFTPGNMVKAYRYIAITFALIFVACQIMVFFLTHDNKNDTLTISREEMLEQSKEKPVTLKDMFKILFRNKQLLVMAIVVLFYTLSSALLTAFGQNFFYFKFGYNGDLVFIFTVIYAVGTLISQGIFPLLASRMKRMTIVTFSTIVTISGFILFGIFANIPLNPTAMFVLLGISAFIVFAGQGTFYMTMLIMLTNTIEYDEWKTGDRNDAIIFSVRPFMVKLSGAFEILTVSTVLLACGLYQITEDVGAIEAEISQGTIESAAGVEQIGVLLKQAGDGQLVGLTLCMTIIPIILMLICFILLKKKYIIDEEMYDKMVKEIKERKLENVRQETN